MLRKILSFSGARLKSGLSFSSAHFKAVILAATIIGFTAMLGAQSNKTAYRPCSAGSPSTPGQPCTGTDNSWAYQSCFGNQQGSCSSGETCYHCKCNADAETLIPVTASGQTCQMWTGSQWNNLSQPWLAASQQTSALKNWIHSNVRPVACQNAASATISISTIGPWQPNGSYDYTMCQTSPFSCSQSIYGCSSACLDPSK